jgi:hypothetical protein
VQAEIRRHNKLNSMKMNMFVKYRSIFYHKYI